MTIGEKIQHYRKQNKMSQEELAKRLLVSRQTVSQWENGLTSPSVDNLSRLRDIFGVSFDAILDQEWLSPPESVIASATPILTSMSYTSCICVLLAVSRSCFSLAAY